MFTKVKVEQNTYKGFETNCKFNRPTLEKKYIKILSRCLSYASREVIFPGIKAPLMHQVRDLCRAGLLERFTSDQSSGYFYKTTAKGRDLIVAALKN